MISNAASKVGQWMLREQARKPLRYLLHQGSGWRRALHLTPIVAVRLLAGLFVLAPQGR